MRKYEPQGRILIQHAADSDTDILSFRPGHRVSHRRSFSSDYTTPPDERTDLFNRSVKRKAGCHQKILSPGYLGNKLLPNYITGRPEQISLAEVFQITQI